MSAFTFDGNQRITSTTGAITHVVDGAPFGAAGALVVTDGTLAPNRFQNGWPMESTGQIAIHIGGTTTQWQNGLPLTSVGRLCSDNTTPVSLFQNGLPLTASRISIA